MTFPLPLVPFEQYMLAENTPDYPRAFVIEAKLTGSLDRDALQTAWQAALTRHPMLSALLTKTRKGWTWTAAATDLPRPIDWAADDAPIELASEFIDLTREPGVRLWVRAGDNSARIVLLFHHSCCDGVGGLQFLGDMLAVYAREILGAESVPQLPPLKPELLSQRGTFGLTRPSVREWLHHVRVTIRESWRLVGRRVISFKLPQTNKGEGATPLEFPYLETHVFSSREQAELRAAAEAAGATLNDLLLSDLFQAMVDWNREEGEQDTRGWMRINLPTNLRRREDMRMPAANVMSFTFVDRHTRECQNSRALLESIRDDTEAIKRGRLGLYFIGQLALLAGIPGAMSAVLRVRRCLSTAVLTNVGEPTKAFSVELPRQRDKLVVGNMLLEEISGTPPLRPLTHLGIGVTTYANQLFISVLCDKHRFTQEQSRRFLETYLARIRQNLSQPALQTAQ